MLKKLFNAAVLAACCMSAQSAMADEWEVTWTGFEIISPWGMYFSADATHTARFSGVDDNHDNILSLDELDSLKIGWQNVTSCPGENYSCGVSAFSYSVTGGVQFSAFYRASYEDQWSGTIDTDNYGYTVGGDFSWDHWGQGSSDEWWVHAFTSQTVETVTLISSVPEPATYAMFGAGMLLLGAAARRRQK